MSRNDQNYSTSSTKVFTEEKCLICRDILGEDKQKLYKKGYINTNSCYRLAESGPFWPK